MSKGNKGGGAGAGGGGAADQQQEGGGGWSDEEMRKAGINPLGMDPDDIDAIKKVGLTPKDLGDLAGKADAATITVSVSTFGKETTIYVNVNSPQLEGPSIRRIVVSPSGNKVIHNDFFAVKEQYQGKGVAREMLRRQVESAQRLGISSIRTNAVRAGTKFVGYYAWASLGYNAKLSADHISTLRSNAAAAGVAVPKNLGAVRDLHGLFKTPGGRELWKKAGFSMDMTFDTRRGSMSNRMLNAK